jgi:aspartate racemase
MVGLIGGMGWESSAEYYRVLNSEVRRRMGGDRSARCLLWSFDFAELSPLVARRDWTPLIDRLVEAAVGLEQQGADLLAICSNTSHIAADAIEAATTIPLVHIADPVSQALHQRDVRRVGVVGTRTTVEQPFLLGRWRDRGFDVGVPGAASRIRLESLIYQHLLRGSVPTEARDAFVSILRQLVQCGAQAIVLACTDFAPLLGDVDVGVPVLDTTALHAHALAERICAAPNGAQETERRATP